MSQPNEAEAAPPASPGRRRKLIAVGIAVLVVLVALTATAVYYLIQPKGFSGTIKVGFTISLTGNYQVEGTNSLKGIKTAVDWINSHSGVSVGGKLYNISLDYYDDQSLQPNVGGLYTRIIQQDSAQFLLAPYSSPLTTAAARAITGRFFRERFRREWIVAVSPLEDGEPEMLLAVDSDQRIVGANRAARNSLLLDDQRLRTGVSLWTLFERDPTLFRRKDTVDFATRLIIAGSDETWPALATPPQSTLGARNPMSAALHTRPRVNIVASLERSAPAPQARGGLPPGAMRRVREYVDAHLGESMDLAELAAVAGLSVFHFARQFRLLDAEPSTQC